MTKRYVYPLLIASSLMLSGCATLELFSFGVSGLSYAVTGKSISDHALSTVMDQDCALHRAVTDEQVCVTPEPPGILRESNSHQGQVVAANERYWQDLPLKAKNTAAKAPTVVSPKGQSTQATVSLAQDLEQSLPSKHSQKPSTRQSPDEVVLALMSNRRQLQQAKSTRQEKPSRSLTQNPSVQSGASHPLTPSSVEVGIMPLQQDNFAIASQQPEPLLYAVLGSYNERHFAEQSLAEFGSLNAQIIDNPARRSDKNATLYRVVAGPFSEAQFNSKVDPNYQAWRIELCPQTLTLPPCMAQMLAQHNP